MIAAKEAVVWVCDETKEVMVKGHCDTRAVEKSERISGKWWGDPIGAAYSGWRECSKQERLTLMLETAIDLAMQGYNLGDVLRAFANVAEFRALGGKSYPMCRALTSALVGKCLEFNTMTFEELLEAYAPERHSG